MTPTAKTAESISQAIEEVAKYTALELQTFKVPQLRELVRSLGIEKIDRDAELIRVSSARKQECIDAILKITRPVKVVEAYETVYEPLPGVDDLANSLKEVVSEELTTYQIADIDFIAHECLKSITDLTFKHWDESAKSWKAPFGWEAEAARLASYLSTRIARKGKNRGEVLTAETQLWYKSLILKAVRKGIESIADTAWYKAALLDYFNSHYCRWISYILKPQQEVKAENGATALNIKKMNRQEVDLTKALYWAESVLESLTDASPKTVWMDVSVALILTTGRRMSEVHYSAKFEKVDDYYVEFSGQLKLKGEAAKYFEQNPSFTIPTLVKADLVMKGLEWLARKGKRQTSPEEVNSKYAKALNAHAKEVAKTCGIEVNEETKLSYHTFRDFYAVAAYKAEEVTMFETSYAAIILGQGRSTKTDRINDMTAANYTAPFSIAPDSKVRL